MSSRQWRIGIDPIKCSGRGLCAELLPELIGMDDWGYPIVSDAPFRRDLLRHARRAVAACPELALFLEPVGHNEPVGHDEPVGQKQNDPKLGKRVRPRGLRLARTSPFIQRFVQRSEVDRPATESARPSRSRRGGRSGARSRA